MCDLAIFRGWRRSVRGSLLAAGTIFLWLQAPVAVASTPDSVEIPEIPPAVDAGEVTIVGADLAPLESGGSTTQFTLQLPQGVGCPGDSASGNWLVQTFLIPEDDDPGIVEYGFQGPNGDQFPLYAVDSRPVAHQTTRIATTADGEGVINALPMLSFEVFPPGYIPAGEYRIGVACTFFRQTARYWDTRIVLVADQADEPAQLTWHVPEAEPFTPAQEGSNALAWTAVGAAVAIGILGAYLFLGRRRTRPGTDQVHDRHELEGASR